MGIKCILLYKLPKGTSPTDADKGMLVLEHQPAVKVQPAVCTFVGQA
jgi:hypothetical protein